MGFNKKRMHSAVVDSIYGETFDITVQNKDYAKINSVSAKAKLTAWERDF